MKKTCVYIYIHMYIDNIYIYISTYTIICIVAYGGFLK